MTAVDAVQVVGGNVFWIEGGSSGDHLRRWSADTGNAVTELPGVCVGSRIYGYGGGSYVVTPIGIVASDAETSALVLQASDGQIRRLVDDGWWYGDLHWDTAAARVLAVRERGAVAELVSIALPGGAVSVIAAGEEFYAAPRAGPDGRRLAWLSWQAPFMPWDRTVFWTAPTDNPAAATPLVDDDESVFCPQWSPQGVLHFMSDRSGWWNLYQATASGTRRVVAADAELGTAQWELGYATYTFLDNGQLALISQRGPHHKLLTGTPSDLTPAAPGYTSIKPYLSTSNDTVAFIGANTTQEPTVVTVRAGSAPRDLTPARHAHVGSPPRQITCRARDGLRIHGLYWPAQQRDGRRPLIVRAHPGPTANATGRLDPYVSYFTSRGYAVVDVDYRGSTGYGRSFRTALRGSWGVADAHDCADMARHLIDRGLAHAGSVVISGSSAGGYTALHAIASEGPFRAATARSAIVDLHAWKAAAPRFQAHHADLLVAPPTYTSSSRDLIAELGTRISRPLLLIHGTRDRIAPVEPVGRLSAITNANGTPCTLMTFDEDHTFRSEEAIRTSFEAELRHYDSALRVGR
ncbi:MAG TPA: prolyl oligopeptidase family serine peptidase [Pseudonocardiaceae bacterium]